ncbi:MAG: hypothetical protein K6A74_10945 [Lachnospiraceae bacterium]|nr:hypothetical protein [Lachnospiraceae bacterium]
MAINGIGYGGFANYRVTDIPSVDIETVKKQDEAKIAEQSGLRQEVESSPISTPVRDDLAVKEDTRSRSANLEDVSLSFNTGDDYSYIGSDSEIGNLDMQKAISDMRKDKILEDYQYFVGSAQDLQSQFANEDGQVFLK